MQTAKGRSDWVELLPELALTINTTTSTALPRWKTPFEVWFGCKFHWLSPQPQDFDTEDQDKEDDDLEYLVADDDKNGVSDLVLSEIETRVAANNARLHTQMIKANSGQSPIFAEGSVATLQIPSKLRLKAEPTRLPVQVLEHKNGQYKLQCQYGRLSG